MQEHSYMLKEKTQLITSLVLMGLFGTILISPNTSAATHSLTLTSSGSQDINISASAGTAISSDSINVSTTCRYGYNFTLSTSVSNNNLYLNGDISNNASGTYFSPVDGTTALNSSTNKWGYYYNSSASNTPTSTSIFSPVPTLNNPATVKTPLTTPASSNINDNFKIYYGVNSAPDMSVGTYKMIPDTNNSNANGTIVYTATMAEACIAYTVHYNPTGTNMGTSVTGTGTVADQTMYEGVATNLTNSYFTGPTVSGTTYYFTGWNTAQDGSGTAYTRGQSVTDLTTVGNTITLYAQWVDCPANRICYTANGSGVIGEMGDQAMPSSATSATLYAPNFNRNNYSFIAWNTKADGTGTNYGPQQTIEFTTGQYNTGGLRLYARWIASNNNMQNWTGCSSMNIGDVTALKDTRDNNVYAVAKLVDGKCWMIENLRLDDSVTLTSIDTHNPSLPLTNVYDTNATSNHLSPTSSLAYDASTAPEGWCIDTEAFCINQSRLRTDNTTLYINNNASNYSYENAVYSYGNYYNWYSATAGNGNYYFSTRNYSVTGDICPTGWHLPKGGDKNNTANNEFWQLIVTSINNGVNPSNYESTEQPYYTDNSSSGITEGTRTSNALRSFPNNFVYSGSVSGSSIIFHNAYVHYWTSTTYGSYSAFRLRINKASVYPGTDTHNKDRGIAVRCIADT